ncbi:cytoplasmic phosphatidylinositol transfer protein 1-like isoform X2 [Daktulosphaira vitifoliae]|uniref:cytoplasmic phosphatidylinositol transfer protein 1-like isoform X2 n=1 Tax=Daktulosphaira vitifoliae TaxID=58002 RepID=UPI0021AAAD19|nr:cytoplasmic phosphatidylinositol transfer protein 1-like isoform X2 [Daktulosphaira vitifoliae]
MVLIKEYRICMPLTVEEYRIGQLYMISRHSFEQTEKGEGVETVVNIPCEDPVHGKGQFTEKRIHLSSRLPYWIQSIIPKVFYIIEKSWNYYPFTVTEYKCSFIPKLCVTIHTKFEDNAGITENCLGLSGEKLVERTVDFVDIAYDEVSSKHYKEDEDLKFFQSKKTLRGPLPENWRNSTTPIMCSYKVVEVSFEVWGIQTKVEDYIQRTIREILLLGHRQAFAWIDDWILMTLVDVRTYECEMQRKTNTKVNACSIEGEEIISNPQSPKSTSAFSNLFHSPSSSSSSSGQNNSSWFSWS